MRKRGFTLIEILVVISILAVLATIVIVIMRGTQSKARDVKRKDDIAAIQKALEMYRIDKNKYPDLYNASYESGDPRVVYNGYDLSATNWDRANWGRKLKDELGSEYIKKLPIDPFNRKVNNINYYYHYITVSGWRDDTYTTYTDTNGAYYQLFAILENSQDPASATRSKPKILPTTAFCGSREMVINGITLPPGGNECVRGNMGIISSISHSSLLSVDKFKEPFYQTEEYLKKYFQPYTLISLVDGQFKSLNNLYIRVASDPLWDKFIIDPS